MNVKKNPFGEKTPSQRLMLLGGTPYDIENEKATTSNSGTLFSNYNPVLITPSTLDELVSVRGELNFLLIYNLIEKWSQSANPRTWDPSVGVDAVKEELQRSHGDLYENELSDNDNPNLYFSAWFEDIPENEPDFVIANPPKQSLVINCSSFPTPLDPKEKKQLAALSQRLPLGHIIPSDREGQDARSVIYNWLYSNFLIRDFAGVRPSLEQYNLIDSTKYKMGAASMLTNGLPGVGKSTDLQIAAIELILQPGPNRDNRKLLYFTHDNTQKRIAQQEIKSILRVAYCANRQLVKRVENSITFVSRKQMFGSIFPAQTPQLDISNFDKFLNEIDIRTENISTEEKTFYQYAAENFLKIVLGWFGSIQKFREFTKEKTFKEAMDSPVQLFHIHENHTTDGLPTLKIGDHWKGYDKKSSTKIWKDKDWTKFNRLLNKITDSKKLRSYENEKGEYWTYSINCEIIDEAYRRLSSTDEKERDNAEALWVGRLNNLEDEYAFIDEEEQQELYEEDKPIWMLENKNTFDAIIIDEVQNFSPISLSVILKHQSNRNLGRERNRDSLVPSDVSPFILKASGDAFQSMTNNTFFENNRHMIDIFRGWGRFVRDQGSTAKSGTGLSEIKDEYLSINHRNSEPIVKTLNLLYGGMFAEQRRTGKITKEIEPKLGAEEGAIIDLEIKQSDNIKQRDILQVVVQSLVDQIQQQENTEEYDVTSRNTFLIIPDKEFTDVNETKNSIMAHIGYLFSKLVEPKDDPYNAPEDLDDPRIEIIRQQLNVLAGKGYANEDIDEFRYLLLCRGIASVKDVQGLTVEAAIVSGLRKKGRYEFRHLQEAFVAFSRPRKILILLDEEDVDNFWINHFPSETNITITKQKVEDYIRSKKGTDFNWFFRKTLKSPYSITRWKNTKSAIQYAKGGYSGILRHQVKIETPPDNNYEALEKIIENMKNLFTNYSNGKLIETWDNVIQLEESTRGGPEELPKELRDLEDLFSEQSFFKLKHFLALQFLHRYAVDEEIQKIAPYWIKKLEEGGEDSFFSKFSGTNTRRSEHLLYVFFHNSLKLIQPRLSNNEKSELRRLNEQAVKYLIDNLGDSKVASLQNPTIGKGRYIQNNLESTIFVGENKDNLWNFPSPPTTPEHDFHYMPVEGEWSLRPKQIYGSFRVLIEKLGQQKEDINLHNLLCQFAALAYINDNDSSIIELIETNPVELNPKDAYHTIEKLLSSPKQHPELFSYLVEKYHEEVATNLCKLENNKELQEDLQKYRKVLSLSSPSRHSRHWRITYSYLVLAIENKLEYRVGDTPWFIREITGDYQDLLYGKEREKIQDVRYSFNLKDQLVKDRSRAYFEIFGQGYEDPSSSFIEELIQHYDEKYDSSKEILGEEFLPPTWTDSIIELIDTPYPIADPQTFIQPKVYHLDYIIPQLIEDEGLEILDYALGNNTRQDECVSNSEFLWRYRSTKDRLEKTVKLCIILLQQNRVSEKVKKRALRFLRRTIITISLNYIQNKNVDNSKKNGDWVYLGRIWRLVIDNHPIESLFEGNNNPFVIGGIDKQFGKTNEAAGDYEIFADIEEHIGFHNWNSLDMSLQKTGNHLIKEIERQKRYNDSSFEYKDFSFGKIKDKKGIIWLTSDKKNFVNKSIYSPRFINPKLNKFRLGSLPNRPLHGAYPNLVRFQHLNKYTFKLIDEIVRGESELDKILCIHSGLIEEWIVQQLNNENFDKKEIINAMIQRMQVSRTDYAPVKKIEASYENLDGLILTKDSDANKVTFSFEIIPKIQSDYKYKQPHQKTADEIMNVKEKLAEILAYLPYLAAREDKKSVHSQIIIQNNPNIKWTNLENEYHEEMEPGKAGHHHVFTLIPLNKEDEGLPIMEWYKENFKLIRTFVENDLNEFMPVNQERHHSLFRYNTLPIESPSVHIAAMLDAGKEPTEIKKQLLEYYPSLGLLRTSDPPSKVEWVCPNCDSDPLTSKFCPDCGTPRGDK